MSFYLRFVVVAFVAYAVANVAGSVVLPWLWRRPTSGSAAARADTLRDRRLAPAIVAGGSLALAAVSFLSFEPRGDETIGLVMLTLAGIATALLAGALVKAVRLARASRRTVENWMAGAVPLRIDGWPFRAFAITSAFPIVAVVGARRPSLIIARSVLAACTADELRAIVAHERGHVDRRDNVVRLWLEVTPDVLSWFPWSRRAAAAWHDATEEAADDCAATLGERGGLLLAEALIRVARLVPAGISSPAGLPASTLYRGENLDRRVRRLLGAGPHPIVDAPTAWWRPALNRSVMIFACVLALRAVYDVIEAAVTFLP